jgi:hypothetical protein
MVAVAPDSEPKPSQPVTSEMRAKMMAHFSMVLLLRSPDTVSGGLLSCAG